MRDSIKKVIILIQIMMYFQNLVNTLGIILQIVHFEIIIIIEMFFYDPKSNKHIFVLDEEKLNVIVWAERGTVSHLRVMRMVDIREKFYALPSEYSKFIYDPETEDSWVQYQGKQGLPCSQLQNFLKSFDLTKGEQYAIAFKRYARNPNTFSLPQQAALYEYNSLKSVNLSKAIMEVSTGKILRSEGAQAKECELHLTSMIN